MIEYYSLAHELRKKQGITAKELGRKVGMSDRSIFLYEQGQRIPPVDIAERIAEELNYKGKLSQMFRIY